MPRQGKNAKEFHKVKLLEFLSNPENDFPFRNKYGGILGISQTVLYRHFSPDDLQVIEYTAVETRKKAFSKDRVDIYRALINYAKSGNAQAVQAAKEFLDRTEGKVTEKIEHGIDKVTFEKIISALPPEFAEGVIKAMTAKD